jgi:cytochrome c oxidase subunit 1
MRPLARLQPYLFALGIMMLSFGMSFAGSMGVSRRSYDIEAAGSIYGPTAHLFLGLVGIGGVLAVLALFIFVGLTVGTILFGKKLNGMPMENWGTPRVLASTSPAPASAAAAEAHPTQGTIILALIFLASFAVYYFANWKALADAWPVR